MKGSLRKQIPHRLALLEAHASLLVKATAGFRTTEWLAFERILQEAGLPLRVLRAGREERVPAAKGRWARAPSRREWDLVCYFFGIRSNDDLEGILDRARLEKRTHEQAPSRERNRLDSTVHRVAQSGRVTDDAVPFHSKRPPSRCIPIPSARNWEAICNFLGIQSRHDLERTVELANSFQDRDRARLRLRPGDQQELLRLDRQVRFLALRRGYGNQREPLLPPNTLQQLEALPALIRLDYSRLCTWYVQRLIAQINLWSIEGNKRQRATARALVEEVARALVLSAGRGRPPGSLGRQPDITQEKAREVLQDVDRRVRALWIPRAEDRESGDLLGQLVREFGDDVINQALASRAERQGMTLRDWITSADAVPGYVISRIAQVLTGLSRRQLDRLLAKGR